MQEAIGPHLDILPEHDAVSQRHAVAEPTSRSHHHVGTEPDLCAKDSSRINDGTGMDPGRDRVGARLKGCQDAQECAVGIINLEEDGASGSGTGGNVSPDDHRGGTGRREELQVLRVCNECDVPGTGLLNLGHTPDLNLPFRLPHTSADQYGDIPESHLVDSPRRDLFAEHLHSRKHCLRQIARFAGVQQQDFSALVEDVVITLFGGNLLQDLEELVLNWLHDLFLFLE